MNIYAASVALLWNTALHPPGTTGGRMLRPGPACQARQNGGRGAGCAAVAAQDRGPVGIVTGPSPG